MEKVSAFALAFALASEAAAQTAPSQDPSAVQAPTPVPAAPVIVRTGVPAGFEDISEAVDTEFDLTFQERRIGSFPGRLENGNFTFRDPAAVVAALGDAVDAEKAREFLAQPLLANEQFR
ncbi:MAG: hypothetical protein EOP58_16365, partial [Sphingomonadales bacterium]